MRKCCLLALFGLLSALCLEHQAVGDITLSLGEWFSTFRSSPVGTPRTAHVTTVFYPRRFDAVTCPGCCLTVGARGKLFVVRVVRRTRVLHSVSASCWCFVSSCRVRCVSLSLSLSVIDVSRVKHYMPFVSSQMSPLRHLFRVLVSMYLLLVDSVLLCRGYPGTRVLSFCGCVGRCRCFAADFASFFRAASRRTACSV